MLPKRELGQPRSRRQVAARAAGFVAAGALFLTGCSSGEASVSTVVPPDANKEAVATGQVPELSQSVFVPSVQVKDVRSGADVDLQSVVPHDKPVLLWAWAPHCPACRAEAAGLEAFAKENKKNLTVVGIGTQDDEAQAREFLADTGVTTPRMLWDPSFQSWQVMGITAQPTWILLNGDGSLIDGWVGRLPEDTVLERIQS